MTNFLLAKPKLPPDVIDFSVGEPHIIRDIFSKIFWLKTSEFPDHDNLWEYPAPNGFKPLVDFLEAKHNAPVIITNGAKQALAASFYTLKKLGKSTLGMRTPYWALIPPLASEYGLTCLEGKYDSYLCILPNNPDGFTHDYQYANYLASYHKHLNIPFIHDAAYYTHTYLPEKYTLGPLGDLQIFSISKMYGLSGLRLGYIVCHNTNYYNHILQYMETNTVGVSSISQKFLYDLFLEEQKDPNKKVKFIEESREALLKAKLLMRAVNSDVFEIPDNNENISGMFGWYKLGPKANFSKAKLNIIDGKLFGVPGFVRLNLAIQEDQLKEAITRLNLL